MSSFIASAIDFHDKLTQFVRDHAAFSDRVFGTVEQRGPVGPLKHMEKEAKEAYEQWEELKAAEKRLNEYKEEEGISTYTIAVDEEQVRYNKELADLFLLLIDAMRRSKMKFGTLLNHAIAKLRENEQREWPPFDPTKVDEAIEHVRTDIKLEGSQESLAE